MGTRRLQSIRIVGSDVDRLREALGFRYHARITPNAIIQRIEAMRQGLEDACERELAEPPAGLFRFSRARK
jgi:hypothetical protein